MTDNNSNATQNDKPLSQQNQNKKPTEHADKANATTVQTVAPNHSASSVNEKPGAAATKPAMKKVDIVIAGITYQIYCPVDEEAELRSAVYYINNFILDIKKDSPSLGQENLLVLCCLNLYEKIHSNDKANNANKQQSKQAEALLGKIMQDAQSIL